MSLFYKKQIKEHTHEVDAGTNYNGLDVRIEIFWKTYH